MPLPQRLTFVTLGARSVERLRDFYRGWGWVEGEGGSDGLASFATGTTRLALYPIDRLRDEAAPGSALPPPDAWNGVTLAMNLPTRAEVDGAVGEALRAGAVLVEQPVDREWGGYSGYVSDPEGHRWELAWAPEPGPESEPEDDDATMGRVRPAVRAPDVEAWRRHLAAPWGLLQARLLRRRLVDWLGPGSFGRVLDVGCGLGDLAAGLAPRADEVTCVDRSQAMLDEAAARLAPSDAVTRFVQRDLDAGLGDLGPFDLIVAHNVVDYAADPRSALHELVARVGPGGRISLSFGNGASVALRHAVRTHDLAAGLELARRPEVGRLPGPCGDSMRLRRADVEAWLEDEGLAIRQRAGVRVVSDLLPNEVKTDDALGDLEALELELGERPELIDVAAIVHLFANRRR